MLNFLKSRIIVMYKQFTKRISYCGTKDGKKMQKELVSYIHDFDLEKVPNEIQLKAKYILLDSLGIIWSNNDSAQLQKFDSRTELKDSYLIKSLVDGIALVSNELDEGNPLAKGHPACHFIPSLLQVRIQKNSSFTEFLEAMIVGYEVGARIGEITRLTAEIHPHANWGIIGGAAAIAKLYKWDEAKIAQAINLASQFAYPTLWQSIMEGHEVRNVLIGMNNLTLTLLQNFIEAGYSASDQTLPIIFSKVLGSSFNFTNLNLDNRTYYLEQTYFKFYDSCRFCHGPIDAIKLAYQQLSIETIDIIKNIEIHTYSSAARLREKNVPNTFAGKFSIPYAVAKETYHYFQQPYTEENLKTFSQLIEIIDSEEINAKLPITRATKLILTTTNNRATSVYLETALGDTQTENLYELVEQKFLKNVENYFSENEAKIMMNKLIVENQFPLEYAK